MATIWDILGIEPTRDEREIRRAYAKKLKLRRPDNDPHGFQELREAFDEAKSYANLGAILDNGIILSYEYPEPIETTVHQIMQQKTAQAEEIWDWAVLDERAQEIATLIIQDECQGLHKLRLYIEDEMSDSLEARQTFSLRLGEELSEQTGLSYPVLERVSEIMDWQVDRCYSSQLPDYLLSALEEQIANTEQEEYWQYLIKKHSKSRLKKFKWRLLTDKITPPPYWIRLIPGFPEQLFKQISEISELHPDLQERLNPILLNEHSSQEIGLSWVPIFEIVIYVAIAWIVKYKSSKMPFFDAVMFFTFIVFIWGFRILINCYKTGGIMRNYTHIFFWIVSVIILLILFRST